MKIKKFLAYTMMAATAFNFSACSSDDDDDDDNNSQNQPTVESIKLSESSVEIVVGKTTTIVATIEPKDVEAEIKWTIEDESIAIIATEDDEEEVVIKGVKAGETTLKVTAGEKSKTCFITVKKANDDVTPPDPTPTNNYSYFVISLPDEEFEKIADKALDMRVNDADMFYYPWEGTYNTLEVASGWGVEVVENTTWSGLGFNYQNLETLANMSAITADGGKDWYFHISLKVNSTTAHLIGLDGESGSYKFAINGDYVDNGVTYKKAFDVANDGEYYDVEVPMTEAINAGLIYSDKPTKKPNLVWTLSGGVAGTQLYLDNIYFYKK